MAPKSKTTPKKQRSPNPEPNACGMFSGMVFFLVEKGVQPRRIQIWKQKLLQMGAIVKDHLSKTVTHILAASSKFLLQEVNPQGLIDMKNVLLFQWLEDSLKQGARAVEDSYRIALEKKSTHGVDQAVAGAVLGSSKGKASDEELKSGKKAKHENDTNVEHGEAGEGSEDLGKTSVQTDEVPTMVGDSYPNDSEMEKSSAESSAGTPQSDFDSSVSDKRNNGETSDQDGSNYSKSSGNFCCIPVQNYQPMVTVIHYTAHVDTKCQPASKLVSCMDNTIAMHGIHRLNWLFNIDIVNAWLLEGENTIFLTQVMSSRPFQGILYDYIRLEEPSEIAL